MDLKGIKLIHSLSKNYESHYHAKNPDLACVELTSIWRTENYAIDPTNYTENKSPKGSIVNYVFAGLTVATIITSLLCIAAIIFL